MVADAGKLSVLDRLLSRLKAEDHRVLIYSQMTRMIDILEVGILVLSSVFARDSIYAIARICDRNSVRPDVRHTGGLYKNG